MAALRGLHRAGISRANRLARGSHQARFSLAPLSLWGRDARAVARRATRPGAALERSGGAGSGGLRFAPRRAPVPTRALARAAAERRRAGRPRRGGHGTCVWRRVHLRWQTGQRHLTLRPWPRLQLYPQVALDLLPRREILGREQRDRLALAVHPTRAADTVREELGRLG